MKLNTLFKCKGILAAGIFYSVRPLDNVVGLYELDTDTMLCNFVSADDLWYRKGLIDYTSCFEVEAVKFTYAGRDEVGHLTLELENLQFELGWTGEWLPGEHWLFKFYYAGKFLCDISLQGKITVRVVLLCASIEDVYRVVLKCDGYYLSLWFDVDKYDMLCYSWGFPCGDLQRLSDNGKGQVLAGKLARLSLFESGRLY